MYIKFTYSRHLSDDIQPPDPVWINLLVQEDMKTKIQGKLDPYI